MPAEGYRITRHASVHELPAAQWDPLTGGNFYLSHRWLAVVETDSQPPPLYLAAWSDGTLAGALPIYQLKQAPGNQLSDPAHVISGAPGAGGWYPALLGGTRIGYASSVLTSPALRADAAAAACRSLLGALAEYAAEAGARSSALLYLNQAGTAQVSGVPGWPLVFSTAEASLRISWPSFEDYLASLSQNARANVRTDMRRFARTGLEARLVPLGEVVAAAAPLAVNVQHKYGHQSSEARQVRFFGDCAAQLRDGALVFGCFDGARLIGFVLAFPWQDTLYIRSTGFDYDAAPRQGEHFIVMFYEPVRYAIAHGLARVHFGTESFTAKLRRGCTLAPLWSAAHRDQPFSDEDLARFRDVSRTRLREWDAEFGGLLGYLPSQRWVAGQQEPSG